MCVQSCTVHNLQSTLCTLYIQQYILNDLTAPIHVQVLYVTGDKVPKMLEVPRQRKSCDWLTLDKARVWLELLVRGDGRGRGFDVAHSRVRRAGRVGSYTRGNARTMWIVNSPVIRMKIRETLKVKIRQM
jgi:hypothetical protein